MADKELSRSHPLFLALAIYFLFLVTSNFLPQGLYVNWLGYVAFCVFTGVLEEAVFCGLVFVLLKRYFGRVVSALLSTALLFALAHIGFAYGITEGLFKVLEAALFSICMVGVYVLSGKLWLPMLAHGLFDFVYFLSGYLEAGTFPPYASSFAMDANICVLICCSLFFAVVDIIIFRFVTKKEEGESG